MKNLLILVGSSLIALGLLTDHKKGETIKKDDEAINVPKSSKPKKKAVKNDTNTKSDNNDDSRRDHQHDSDSVA